MKKVHNYFFLLLLVSFVKINSEELKDYSKMSSNELEEAFISAVKIDDQDAVKGLIQAGVDANMPIPYRFTSGGCDWETTSTPLIYAARNDRPNIVKVLPKSKKEMVEALYVAIEEGRLEVLEELIKEGADFNCENGNKDTPLIYAIQNAFADTEFSSQAQSRVRSRFYKRRGIVRALLEAGANVSHKNKQGKTALMEAVSRHDFYTVQKLLQASEIKTGSFFGFGKKPINYADIDGNTALIIAIKNVRTSYIDNQEYNICVNSQKIIQSLLETPGINVHHVNKQGETAVKLLNEINNNFKSNLYS